MTTCFSILAWRIPGTEEPGGLRFFGSQSLTRLSTHTLQEWSTFPPSRWWHIQKGKMQAIRRPVPLVCQQRSPSCHLLLHLSGVRALVQMFSSLVREEHFFEKEVILLFK